MTQHGGAIVEGCPTVIIGEGAGGAGGAGAAAGAAASRAKEARAAMRQKKKAARQASAPAPDVCTTPPASAASGPAGTPSS